MGTGTRQLLHCMYMHIPKRDRSDMRVVVRTGGAFASLAVGAKRYLKGIHLGLQWSQTLDLQPSSDKLVKTRLESWSSQLSLPILLSRYDSPTQDGAALCA